MKFMMFVCTDTEPERRALLRRAEALRSSGP